MALCRLLWYNQVGEDKRSAQANPYCCLKTERFSTRNLWESSQTTQESRRDVYSATHMFYDVRVTSETFIYKSVRNINLKVMYFKVHGHAHSLPSR